MVDEVIGKPVADGNNLQTNVALVGFAGAVATIAVGLLQHYAPGVLDFPGAEGAITTIVSCLAGRFAPAQTFIGAPK